jgi:hypothetical protein
VTRLINLCKKAVLALAIVTPCLAAAPLAHADPLPAQQQASNPIVGTWAHVESTNHGVEITVFVVGSNGRFALVTGDPDGHVFSNVKGTYTISGNRILLHPEGAASITVSLQWKDSDSFVDGAGDLWVRYNG